MINIPRYTLILLLAWLFYHLAQHLLPEPQRPLLASEAPAELYSNQGGDNLSNLFVKAIDEAEHSITLLIYTLADRTLIEALDRASQRGVTVYIVCDGKASPNLSHKLPNATIVNRYGIGLMHQKILVTDEKHVWLGSANFTHSSLYVHGNLVVELYNPRLAHYLTERAKRMDGDFILEPEVFRGEDFELYLLPNEHEAVEKVLSLLRSAKKTLQIALFTWTRFDFAREIVEASKRGVQVEVFIDRQSGRGASAPVVTYLLNHGVNVRFNRGNKLLHYKFALIDNQTLVHGSANWTKSAFEKNDDFLLILSPLNEKQQHKMDRVLKTIEKESILPIEHEK